MKEEIHIHTDDTDEFFYNITDDGFVDGSVYSVDETIEVDEDPTICHNCNEACTDSKPCYCCRTGEEWK